MRKGKFFSVVEIERLSKAILNLDENSSFDDIEDKMMYTFGVDLDQFASIANALVMFTQPFYTDSGEHYCFGVKEGDDFFKALAVVVKEKNNAN